jgi:hypothetical protein
MKVDGFGGWIRLSDWLTRSFPWLRPFATDLWGGLTDLKIQGLCMSLLIEPFKKILHCHWLIFSTDSQREVFVNTALVFTSECLLFRTSGMWEILLFLRAISTSDIWKHFRQCSVCDCGKRFGISTTFVHGAWKEYRCLTDEFCWQATEPRHQQHKQKPRDR